jgi:hypothetical protein
LTSCSPKRAKLGSNGKGQQRRDWTSCLLFNGTRRALRIERSGKEQREERNTRRFLSGMNLHERRKLNTIRSDIGRLNFNALGVI